MVWLPCIYTSQTYFLVKHPIDLNQNLAIAIFIAGLLCIWINYDADRQRQHFRQTEGKCIIWGRAPKIVRAKYLTGDGKELSSILLASGWWGLARHWHYVPEILASFFWSMPGFFALSFMPWFYVLYLTILLTDRAWRDDERCRGKYTIYWDEYCRLVPAKILPGII